MVTDDDNPMLLKKKECKKNPLWDTSDVPSSMHPSQYLKSQGPKLPKVVPYIRSVDLNDSGSDDEGRQPKCAIEIGIKGTF